MNKPINVEALREKADTPQALVPASDTRISAWTSLQGFELVQRMAKGLQNATLIPKRFQQNIADTMIAINMAQRVNCDPLMVMQNIYVVHGSPAWSGQFVIAAINESGMFKGPLRFQEVGERGTDEWGFYAEATSRDGYEIKGPTITIGMAKDEGWYKSNAKWQTIPELMLRYRAGAWFGRTQCPELLMGFKSEEEIRDIIDVEAVVVDAKRPNDEPELDIPVPDGTPEATDPEAAKVAEALKHQGYYYSASTDTFFNADGEEHDPEIHATDGDGLPIVNKDGSFRAKRGAKAATDAETAASSEAKDDSEDDGFDLE